MRKFTKLAALASGAAAVAGVAMIPSLVSAWGDNSGLTNYRPTYTIEQINSHVLGNRVVLNSISDSPNTGDERFFVGAREYDGANQTGKVNTWENASIQVKDGQEYIIRLYVHNNNEYGEQNPAKDVKVAFSIPEDSAKSLRVDGIITSSNANPNPEKAGTEGKYYSYVDFTSTSDFHLEYVYGSALLENNGIGAKGLKLDDTLVTRASSGGQMIGYFDHGDGTLDGIIPGCFQYVSYVTIRVKAVFDTDFRVTQKVRILGDDKWHNYVDAKVGDKLEFQTQYKNTDFRDNTHNNVAMKAILPKNLKYVNGSTKIFTALWPNGLTIDQDTIIGSGIGIGTYDKGANAYIRFTAEVTDENLVCGTTGLVNWVQASVGQVTLQDYATIRVYKQCDGQPDPEDPDKDPAGSDDPNVNDYPDKTPDTPSNNPDKFPNDKPSTLPNTGPTSVASGIIATGSLATAAGYYISSRRQLR